MQRKLKQVPDIKIKKGYILLGEEKIKAEIVKYTKETSIGGIVRHVVVVVVKDRQARAKAVLGYTSIFEALCKRMKGASPVYIRNTENTEKSIRLSVEVTL